MGVEIGQLVLDANLSQVFQRLAELEVRIDRLKISTRDLRKEAATSGDPKAIEQLGEQLHLYESLVKVEKNLTGEIRSRQQATEAAERASVAAAKQTTDAWMAGLDKVRQANQAMASDPWRSGMARLSQQRADTTFGPSAPNLEQMRESMRLMEEYHRQEQAMMMGPERPSQQQFQMGGKLSEIWRQATVDVTSYAAALRQVPVEEKLVKQIKVLSDLRADHIKLTAQVLVHADAMQRGEAGAEEAYGRSARALALNTKALRENEQAGSNSLAMSRRFQTIVGQLAYGIQDLSAVFSTFGFTTQGVTAAIKSVGDNAVYAAAQIGPITALVTSLSVAFATALPSMLHFGNDWLKQLDAQRQRLAEMRVAFLELQVGRERAEMAGEMNEARSRLAAVQEREDQINAQIERVRLADMMRPSARFSVHGGLSANARAEIETLRTGVSTDFLGRPVRAPEVTRDAHFRDRLETAGIAQLERFATEERNRVSAMLMRQYGTQIEATLAGGAGETIERRVGILTGQRGGDVPINAVRDMIRAVLPDMLARQHPNRTDEEAIQAAVDNAARKMIADQLSRLNATRARERVADPAIAPNYEVLRRRLEVDIQARRDAIQDYIQSVGGVRGRGENYRLTMNEQELAAAEAQLATLNRISEQIAAREGGRTTEDLLRSILRFMNDPHRIPVGAGLIGPDQRPHFGPHAPVAPGIMVPGGRPGEFHPPQRGALPPAANPIGGNTPVPAPAAPAAPVVVPAPAATGTSMIIPGIPGLGTLLAGAAMGQVGPSSPGGSAGGLTSGAGLLPEGQEDALDPDRRFRMPVGTVGFDDFRRTSPRDPGLQASYDRMDQLRQSGMRLLHPEMFAPTVSVQPGMLPERAATQSSEEISLGVHGGITRRWTPQGEDDEGGGGHDWALGQTGGAGLAATSGVSGGPRTRGQREADNYRRRAASANERAEAVRSRIGETESASGNTMIQQQQLKTLLEIARSAAASATSAEQMNSRRMMVRRGQR